MPPENGKPKQRLPIFIWVLMIGVGILADLLQAPLDLTGFMSVAASFLGLATEFGLVLWMKLQVPDMELFSKNGLLKLLAVGAPAAITFIPELNILPELTAGIIVLGAQIRFEDSLKDPAFAKKVGVAAKVVSVVQPEFAVAAKVVNQQVQKQAAVAQVRARQEARAQEKAANDNVPPPTAQALAA